MSKITYTYPHDGLTVKAVHAHHRESLFFELLFPVIEQQAKNEYPAEELLDGLAENWAKQELGVLGFVSTYHLWERQLQELFLEQSERSDIDIPRQNPREDIVGYGKRVLLDTFEVSVPDRCWAEFNRARAVVNAFKHGPSQKFDIAMQLYPDYFFKPIGGAHLPCVSVSLEQLRTFIRTVASFWEELPRKIDYAHRGA